MGGMGRLESLLCAAALMGALIACKGGEKGAGSGSSAANEKPIVVKATDLFDDYHKNEVAADEKYKDKTLRVVGIIASIDKDALNNIVLRLATANQFQTVMATMKDSEKSKVMTLSKGQPASVECRGAGMIIGAPSLRDCTVFGTGTAPASK